MRAHLDRLLHVASLVAGFVVTLLALVAFDLAPASAGGGGCHRDRQVGPTEASGTTVELVDFCMSPSVLRVEPGAAVRFTNRDSAPHNVVGSGMFVDQLTNGESIVFRFDDPGTFAYACTFHPAMVGAIAVGDGRRTAPATESIAPIEVSDRAVPPTTLAAPPTTLAPQPLASRHLPTDQRGLPVAPILLGVGVAVAVLVGALGHRVVASTSPWRTTNQPSASSAHARNPAANAASSSTVANP